MSRYKIEGMKELERSLRKLGKVPQKHVTSSSRKGMNIALRTAKTTAPFEEGDLRGGMKLIGEKSKTKGKKVYKVVFDDSKNDIFQTKDKNGKVNGYYPASQEYGFFAKNGRYIPGFHFLKKSLESNAKKIERKIMTDMQSKIDKELGR